MAAARKERVDASELVPARRAVRQQLESLQRAGVRQMGRSTSRRGTPHPATPADIASPSQRPAEFVPAMAAAAEPGEQLLVLADEVRQCTRCSELVSSRTQTVFGTGNPRARLCFFGEAPGADEDLQGEPFVGAAGKLLNDILRACTLRREDVYILNVLKCRPPKNRTPVADEVENCRSFFERQLAIIQPEFICCLGAVASNALLQHGRSLREMRGTFHDWRGSRVMVTYHPAYLLRNPPAKRDVWEDMQLLMKEMGIPVKT